MQTINRRHALSVLAGLPWAARIARAETEPSQIDVSLVAKRNWVRVGISDAYLDTYNGVLPGPALEARPGDQLTIRFRNDLPEPTNLHYHGLHVPPAGRADNAMLTIPPGEQFDYQFEIPQAHPAGTFWYHPHVHGFAAGQVSRGLAGVIVIRGELDVIPEIAAASEHLIVLQDFSFDRNGVPVEPSFMEQVSGREGSVVTVSGRIRPTIPIEQGGWVRLRTLNASSSRFYRLALEEHAFSVIATDGGAVTSPVECTELLVAPGERVEAMVQGLRPQGQYRLLNLPYRRSAGLARASRPEVLATVEYVAASSEPWSLPRKLSSIDLLPEPSVRRTFLLGGGMGMSGMGGGGMAFTINGRAFNPNRVDTVVRLDTVEDWRFVNPSTMDHPMHVHTNPFQVIGSDGTPSPTWKDVVIVPAQSAVTVRTSFRDFVGTPMYHCHILDHEDLGMMATLQILAREGSA